MGGFFRRDVKRVAFTSRELSKRWLFPEESGQKGGFLSRELSNRGLFQ